MPEILTRSDYERCESCLARVAKAKAELDRAKQIGLDLEELERELKAIEDMAVKIKAVYFPGMP